MKYRFLIPALWLLVAQVSLAETPAVGAGAPTSQKEVTVNLVQSKVTKDEKGIEKLIEAASVKPNDVIEYRVTYTNVTANPVKGFVANLPIPAGLQYLPSSAKPSRNAVVATEDGQFSPEPLVKKLPNGTTEPVPYTEYRHVRWNVGTLAPGASVDVFARVKVEAFAATPPAATPVKSTAK